QAVSLPGCLQCTLSRIDTATDAVNNSFASLGNVPNKIVVDADYIWCVNSGDNAIQKISRNSGSTLANIFIAPGCNPWDALKHENYLYISGLFTGKVYRVDTLSGSVTGTVNTGTAPEALHVIGDKLYVSNAGNYSQNYAGSSVTVIDLPSFTALTTIPVSANPQYLASHNGLLHVSCTGNYAGIGGAICIIEPATDTLIHTIPMGGTPASIFIANPAQAWVSDSNGAVLYAYNPESFELINGGSNPISGGGSEIVGNASMLALLSPNWGGNGTVRLLNHDLGLLRQYTVAMMPTDLKLDYLETSTSDLVAQAPPLRIFPNPVRQGSKLEVSSARPLYGEFCLYNAKGQKLLSHPLDGKSSFSLELKLPAGVYFYRLPSSGKQSGLSTGKLVIL
ncbi:MAG TPA: T9SS type A sorting domain-containing protein, partial [Candidatus Cloacimonadota bacterium]|nr:T9SS type A sorting domain-containing protein [Candidatus Cloacimonadota bacterium]